MNMAGTPTSNMVAAQVQGVIEADQESRDYECCFSGLPADVSEQCVDAHTDAMQAAVFYAEAVRRQNGHLVLPLIRQLCMIEHDPKTLPFEAVRDVINRIRAVQRAQRGDA